MKNGVRKMDEIIKCKKGDLIFIPFENGKVMTTKNHVVVTVGKNTEVVVKRITKTI